MKEIDFSVPIDQRDIGWAIRCVKSHHKVARREWRGSEQYLELFTGQEDKDDENFELTPFVVVRLVDWTYAPYVPSPADMLAEDWELV